MWYVMSFHDMILSCYITLKNMASKKEEEKAWPFHSCEKSSYIFINGFSFAVFFCDFEFSRGIFDKIIFFWRFLLSSHELLLNFNEICSKNYINNLDRIRRKYRIISCYPKGISLYTWYVARHIVIAKYHDIFYIMIFIYRYTAIVAPPWRAANEGRHLL